MASEHRHLLLDDDSDAGSDAGDFSSSLPSSNSDNIWELDEAVKRVGVGRYQYILWFFLSLVSLSCGFNNMAMVFEGGEGGHTCVTPHNHTSDDNMTVTHYFPGECSYNKTVTTNNSLQTKNIKCDKWVYNRTVFNSTINTEWNLMCGKESLAALPGTIYMLGFFTGCIILGDLADRFGRRLLLMLSALLTLVAAVGAAYSPDLEVFTALRFFIGMGVAGTRNSAYIMSAELARPKDRGTLGLLSDMTYSIAYILTGVIFYFNPNWRQFQLYIGLFHIFYLTYIFFLPESPRWLLSQGREEKALNYFRTSAKINKKCMPEDIRVILPHQSKAKHSTLDLVRTKNLRAVGLVSVILWFIVSLVYFGMSYNVSNMQGSIYVNNAILGGVELVANSVGIFVVRIGRRPAIGASFLVAFGAMLAMIFAQGDYWAIIILAILGKFVISPCFSYIYISTTELYPTQTRTLALGVGSGMARLGGAVATLIPPTYAVWNKLPYIIFSSACLLGALDSLLLPETMNRPLPDSIASAEKMNAVRCHARCCRPPPEEEVSNSVTT